MGIDDGPAFAWKLRERMALKGMWHTNQLVVPLAERGIELSRTQVYRLVTEPPGRVSVRLLLALCDILDCTFEQLAVPVQEDAAKVPARASRRRRAAGGGPAPATPPSDPVPKAFFEDL
jgi:hypothetical protein